MFFIWQGGPEAVELGETPSFNVAISRCESHVKPAFVIESKSSLIICKNRKQERYEVKRFGGMTCR